jgi:hypothetical protein
MNKYSMTNAIIAGALISLCSVANAQEVSGDEAKSIVMSGEVLGMTLFDDFFKNVFEEESVGFIYSVIYENDLYYCFNYQRSEWFCETF